MRHSGERSLNWCIDSPGFGGAEIDLVRTIRMLGCVGSLHYADTIASELGREARSVVKIHNSLARGNSIWSFPRGFFKALMFAKRDPDALFVLWCHHLDSNRWLQLALALSRRDYMLIEKAVPANRSDLRKSRLTIPLKKFAIGRAKAVVLNADGQKGHYPDVLGLQSHSKLCVIKNSRPVGYIQKRVRVFRSRAGLRGSLGLSEEAWVVVCVARLSEEKGVGDLIAAFRLCIKVTPRMQLVLVGDGERRKEYEALASDLPRNAIRFVGHVKDITPFLAAADAFALPSLHEGLPGALIEAMAAELPCVASHIPGVLDLIDDGVTGLTVPVKDPAKLCESLLRLRSGPDFARRLASNAFELVMRSFNEDTERSAWAELLGIPIDANRSALAASNSA